MKSKLANMVSGDLIEKVKEEMKREHQAEVDRVRKDSEEEKAQLLKKAKDAAEVQKTLDAFKES